MYNAVLRTDYDVTDNLTLTSITSYSDYKRNSRAADDGTAVQDYDYVANDGYIRDFNQELRLSNDAASRMRVTVGANYQHSKVYELSKPSYGDSIVSNFSQIDGTSTLLPVPFSRGSDFSRQTIENNAFFGNVDFDVTYTITVKGGLRSEEHTSELQSLMRISYAVFCLKTKNTSNHTIRMYSTQHQT